MSLFDLTEFAISEKEFRAGATGDLDAVSLNIDAEKSYGMKNGFFMIEDAYFQLLTEGNYTSLIFQQIWRVPLFKLLKCEDKYMV